MRVLHVLPNASPDRGGPARSVRRLVEALRSRGLQVRLAAAGDAAADCPVSHLRLPAEIPDRESRARLAEAIDWAQVVEIHSLWNGTATVAAAIARAASVPYVLAPRGMLDPTCIATHRWRKEIWRRLVDRRTIPGAAAFHFLSEEERDRARLPGARAVQRVISPNGAPELDTVPPGRLRERFGDLGDRRILLALGRLDPIKGLDFAIRALARIQAGDRPALLIVGPDYGEGAALADLARREGVSGDVLIREPIYGDDRFGLLAEADLVTLTSRYDCNPVVATEALAAGGAVLAVEGCGLSGWAREGAVAVVPRSLEAFAAEVVRLLRAPQALAALRAAGRAHAKTRLSWHRVVDPLIELYEGLAA